MNKSSRIKGRLSNGSILKGSSSYPKGSDEVNVNVRIIQRNKKFVLSFIEYISEAYPEDGIILKKESKEFNTLEEALDYIKNHTIVKIENLHF